MRTYLAIGSVAWDVVEGDPTERLGGSVPFACRAALDAGWDARLHTSGTEKLELALRAALPGVAITVQRSAHDTVMAFPRRAELGPRAVPTVADPIEVAASVDGATLVHLAPIMGEITPALVEQVVRAPFVGLTPQGLLRNRAPGTGALSHRTHLDPWWSAHVDAAVLSEPEHAALADPSELAGLALAVTRGERGCIGYLDGEVCDVPGIAVDRVSGVGTIGAGDVFAANCFMALASGRPFADALRHANQRAAAHVGGGADR